MARGPPGDHRAHWQSPPPADGGADPKRLAASVPLDLVREIMSMLGTDHVAWTVAGAPNPAWAESIFGIPDVDRLWRAIAVATRLDEKDPVDAWRAHLA